MIRYDESKNTFQDQVDFGPNDPCVWVVYPAGGAGDLLATIIHHHYANSGSSFRGIDDTGAVKFFGTDNKLVNTLMHKNKLLFDDQFFYNISKHLGNHNYNYSMLDQVIFSAHCNNHFYVNLILQKFSQAKVIRISPGSLYEQAVIKWLSDYKNLNKLSNFVPASVDPIQVVAQGPRVLDIAFGQLINPAQFESTYSKVVELLGLPGKLIRYDFVQYWLDHQHPQIRPALDTIIEHYDS